MTVRSLAGHAEERRTAGGAENYAWILQFSAPPPLPGSSQIQLQPVSRSLAPILPASGCRRRSRRVSRDFAGYPPVARHSGSASLLIDSVGDLCPARVHRSYAGARFRAGCEPSIVNCFDQVALAVASPRIRCRGNTGKLPFDPHPGSRHLATSYLYHPRRASPAELHGLSTSVSRACRRGRAPLTTPWRTFHAKAEARPRPPGGGIVRRHAGPARERHRVRAGHLRRVVRRGRATPTAGARRAPAAARSSIALCTQNCGGSGREPTCEETCATCAASCDGWRSCIDTCAPSCWESCYGYCPTEDPCENDVPRPGVTAAPGRSSRLPCARRERPPDYDALGGRSASGARPRPVRQAAAGSGGASENPARAGPSRGVAPAPAPGGGCRRGSAPAPGAEVEPHPVAAAHATRRAERPARNERHPTLSTARRSSADVSTPSGISTHTNIPERGASQRAPAGNESSSAASMASRRAAYAPQRWARCSPKGSSSRNAASARCAKVETSRSLPCLRMERRHHRLGRHHPSGTRSPGAMILLNEPTYSTHSGSYAQSAGGPSPSYSSSP